MSCAFLIRWTVSLAASSARLQCASQLRRWTIERIAAGLKMNIVNRIVSVLVVGIGFASNAFADAGGCPRRYEPVVDAYSGAITCVPRARGGSDGSGAADSGSPPLADLYMAIVAHPLTPQLWVSSGYLNPKDAERAALTACRSAMFEPGDCMAQMSAHNSQYIGSVRNGRGATYLSVGDSIDNSSAAAMQACKRENDTCKEGKVFYNTLAQTDNFPQVPVKEYLSATLAMPDPKAKISPQVKGRYWLSSGLPGSKSIPAALAQCQNAFGANCQIVAHSSGGVIAVFATSGGHDFLANAWEKSWLENNVNKVCEPSLRCKLFQVFDSNQIVDRMIE